MDWRMDAKAKESRPDGYASPNHVWMDQLTGAMSVIATKYTTNFRAGPNQPPIMANFVGNGAKSLATSVNASLKKLQTDYIDLVSSSRIVL